MVDDGCPSKATAGEPTGILEQVSNPAKLDEQSTSAHPRSASDLIEFQGVKQVKELLIFLFLFEPDIVPDDMTPYPLTTS